MREIFHASYNYFYKLAIACIWIMAIVFALVQSTFFAKLVVLFAANQANIKVANVSGSLFGGLIINNIEIDDGKIDEAIVDISPFLYDNGKININYISIVGASFSQDFIKKQLDSNGSTPKWLKGIEIRKLIVGVRNIGYDEFNISKATFTATNIYSDLKTAKFKFSIDCKSNIIDLDAKGDLNGSSYTLAGNLNGVSHGYIEKIADDSDFDFAALKKTPFTLHGNAHKINAEFDIKNSGVLYKFDTGTKIVDAKSYFDMNLSNYHFNVRTVGRIATRYVIGDADFNVAYNGHTRYYGDVLVKDVLYVPLGVFKTNVKLESPKIKSAKFDGNITFLKVEAVADTNAIIADDEPVAVQDLKTVVNWGFKTKSLLVNTSAHAKTDYGELDTNVTVSQENFGLVKFKGDIVSQKIYGIAPKDYYATASFYGDDTFLNASAKLDDGGAINVGTKDYKDFSFVFKNSKLNLKDFFDLSKKFNGSYANVDVSGVYNNPSKLWQINANVNNGTILNRKINANNIKIALQKGVLDIEPATINIGKTQITAQAHKNSTSSFFAKVSSKGSSINIFGSLKPLDLNISAIIPNLAEAKKDFGEFVDLEKEQMYGSLVVNAKLSKDNNTTRFVANAKSPMLSVGGLELSNIDTNIEFANRNLLLKNFDADMFEKRVSAKSMEPIVFLQNGLINLGTISLNKDKLTANGQYNTLSKIGDIKLVAKQYFYYDPRFAKGNIDGVINAHIAGTKLLLSGRLDGSNVDVLYKSPSFSIANDKDIIVVKDAKSPIARSWFTKDCSIDINISTKNPAKYNTQDGNLTIIANGVAIKEFGRRLGFNGELDIGGSYFAVGKVFGIKKGDIAVKYGNEENPNLNVQLEYLDKKDNVIIYVFVNGPQSNPRMTFASNPSMSGRDILSYLAFGVSSGGSFSQHGTQAQQSAQAVAMLSSYLSRNILGELGAKIDSISVTDSDREMGNSKIQVGTNITKNVSIIYQQDINARVGVKYNFSPNLGAVMTSGQNGGSAELTYTQDY